MKSLLSLTVLMLVASAIAFSQQEQHVNPLNALGLSFGASATDVIQACQRAGLTIDRIDTSSKSTAGYFHIIASGAEYQGRPATLRLGGGGVGLSGRQMVGLRSVWAIIRADSSSLLTRVHASSVEALTSSFGSPTSAGNMHPEQHEMLGFSQTHFWRVKSGREGMHLHVTVDANVDIPIRDQYMVAVQYALID